MPSMPQQSQPKSWVALVLHAAWEQAQCRRLALPPRAGHSHSMLWMCWSSMRDTATSASAAHKE